MSVFSYNQPVTKKRSENKAEVLVFDKCPLFRQAFVELLEKVPAFGAVRVTKNGVEVASDPSVVGAVDFVVIDLDTGAEGLGILECIKSQNLPCRCIMLITDGTRAEMMAAIRMQADGLSKRLTADEFVQQFEQVVGGNMVISDSLTNALAVTLRNVPYPDDTRDMSVLSPREVEVLTCISAGMSNKSDCRSFDDLRRDGQGTCQACPEKAEFLDACRGSALGKPERAWSKVKKKWGSRFRCPFF